MLVEPLLELHHVLPLERNAELALAADVFGKLVAENGADFVAKCNFGVAESDVHGAPRDGGFVLRETDCHRMRLKDRPNRAESGNE
jgi:hypothetical protein